MKYEIELKGKTPYMQHRMDDQSLEDWEKNRKLIIERNDVAKEDLVRAEFHAYSDSKGFYMPSEHIRSSLINAGSYLKSKVGNSKKSMKNVVAGMFFIEPDKIRLPKEFEIDKRSAVNRNIKARIITIRPKWIDWKVKFILMIDNDTITEQTVKELFKASGDYVGIGSFRPEHNGMFGRYELTSIKKV